MLLAQTRYWRASHAKSTGIVSLEVLKTALPEALYDLKDMRIEVPVSKWNLVVKRSHSDRKLLGGLLLDFAKNKERVSLAVGNDRLLAEFRQVVIAATLVLIEEELAVITDTSARAE